MVTNSERYNMLLSTLPRFKYVVGLFVDGADAANRRSLLLDGRLRKRWMQGPVAVVGLTTISIW